MNPKVATAIVFVGAGLIGAGIGRFAVIPWLKHRRGKFVESQALLMKMLDPILEPLTPEQKKAFWDQPQVEDVIRGWEDGVYTKEQFEQAMQFVVDHYLN